MANIQYINENQNSILITLENGEDLLFENTDNPSILKLTRCNQLTWDEHVDEISVHEILKYLVEMVNIPNTQAKPMTEIILETLVK